MLRLGIELPDSWTSVHDDVTTDDRGVAPGAPMRELTVSRWRAGVRQPVTTDGVPTEAGIGLRLHSRKDRRGAEVLAAVKPRHSRLDEDHRVEEEV